MSFATNFETWGIVADFLKASKLDRLHRFFLHSNCLNRLPLSLSGHNVRALKHLALCCPLLQSEVHVAHPTLETIQLTSCNHLALLNVSNCSNLQLVHIRDCETLRRRYEHVTLADKLDFPTIKCLEGVMLPGVSKEDCLMRQTELKDENGTISWQLEVNESFFQMKLRHLAVLNPYQAMLEPKQRQSYTDLVFSRLD